MSGEDKKTNDENTVKSATLNKRSLKSGLVLVGVIILVLVVTLVVPFAHGLKTYRSRKLSNQIHTLTDGNHQCSDGLSQLKSTAPKLADSKSYTNDARDKALNYLMACSFMEGNTHQALQYADQLRAVYAAEGNSPQKVARLNVFVTFMKGYKK